MEKLRISKFRFYIYFLVSLCSILLFLFLQKNDVVTKTYNLAYFLGGNFLLVFPIYFYMIKYDSDNKSKHLKYLYYSLTLYTPIVIKNFLDIFSFNLFDTYMSLISSIVASIILINMIFKKKIEKEESIVFIIFSLFSLGVLIKNYDTRFIFITIAVSIYLIYLGFEIYKSKEIFDNKKSKIYVISVVLGSAITHVLLNIIINNINFLAFELYFYLFILIGTQSISLYLIKDKGALIGFYLASMIYLGFEIISVSSDPTDLNLNLVTKLSLFVLSTKVIVPLLGNKEDGKNEEI